MSWGLYADHNATTPLLPGVLDAMLPWLRGGANASSGHRPGRKAAAAVEGARHQVARLLGVASHELVFASGATEALHLALSGLSAARPHRRRLLVSAVEHPAARAAARRLEAAGVTVETFAVDLRGRVDLDALAGHLGSDVLAVVAMAANNETGIVLPTEALGDLCRSARVPLVVDASQAAGRVRLVPPGATGPDLVVLSAHKMGGPQGVGALRVRRGLRIVPLWGGGGQEGGLRPGTVNVAGVVGLGEAAARSARAIPDGSWDALSLRRAAFERDLRRSVPGVVIVGEGAPRLPNTSCIAIDGVSAPILLDLLDRAGVQASSTAACRGNAPGATPMALAFGLDADLRNSVVRFSFDTATTADDLARLLRLLSELVPRATVAQPPRGARHAAWTPPDAHARISRPADR